MYNQHQYFTSSLNSNVPKGVLQKANTYWNVQRTNTNLTRTSFASRSHLVRSLMSEWGANEMRMNSLWSIGLSQLFLGIVHWFVMSGYKGLKETWLLMLNGYLKGLNLKEKRGVRRHKKNEDICSRKILATHYLNLWVSSLKHSPFVSYSTYVPVIFTEI